jgi:hypothetical protein
LITAAGEIVVGNVGIPILPAPALLAAPRFTIFGAPRTTVRPSSSSSDANFGERVEGAPDIASEALLGGGVLLGDD